MDDLSWVIILFAVILGGLVITVVGFLLVSSRRESNESRLKEVAAKLQEDLKLKESGVEIDIIHSVKLGSTAPGVVGASSQPYTRLRASHQGNMPCVIIAKTYGLLNRGDHKVGTLSVRFMNIETFEAAKRQGLHDLDLPQKVHIGGKKVSTAVDKEMLPRCIDLAKSIFNAGLQKAIQEVPFSVLLVEPSTVALLREGYVLSEHDLRKMADFLLLLSDSLHKATGSLRLVTK